MLDEPEYENGNHFQRGHRQSFRQDVFRRVYVPKSLHGRRRHGHHRIRVKLPGSVRCFDITPNNPLIVQKSGFLASESTVELSVHFQKRFGAGLFGGEGFIMQKLSGFGKAFIEIDGHAVEYDLRPGQSIVVDTGYLAAMSATCTMDIQSVRGVKNVLFGGEGFFNTVVTGPGKVLLQTMPINAVAGSIAPYIPSGGKN